MASVARLLSSRRNRLIAVLVVATVAISALAISSAGSTLSYYVTPEEFAQQIDPVGHRWRVGGRVVPDSIVEQGGRPVRFEIVGDKGEHMTISYPDGALPSLFGPNAFVVVEGVADGPGVINASSVIIKHEDEFLTATPTTPTS
jgi:cytochrome c-type biogenesis protein CcmE